MKDIMDNLKLKIGDTGCEGRDHMDDKAVGWLKTT